MNYKSILLQQNSEFRIQNSFNFLFKVGCEHALAYGITYLTECPEASTVELCAGANFAFIYRFIYVYQFPFTLRLKDVAQQKLGYEVLDAQFFAHFATQCIGNFLAVIHVTTYGRIPLAGLNILPQGSLLKVEAPLGVKHMQMYHGMQRLAAVVALASGGLADYAAFLVDEGEEFLVIVLHCLLFSLSRRRLLLLKLRDEQ